MDKTWWKDVAIEPTETPVPTIHPTAPSTSKRNVPQNNSHAKRQKIDNVLLHVCQNLRDLPKTMDIPSRAFANIKYYQLCQIEKLLEPSSWCKICELLYLPFIKSKTMASMAPKHINIRVHEEFEF